MNASFGTYFSPSLLRYLIDVASDRRAVADVAAISNLRIAHDACIGRDKGAQTDAWHQVANLLHRLRGVDWDVRQDRRTTLERESTHTNNTEAKKLIEMKKAMNERSKMTQKAE
jgi:hypothetical protein